MPTTIETLSLQNYSDNNIVEELELSQDAAAGQAIISVINSNNIAAFDYVVLSPGEEIAELRQVQSVSGNNITFTANLSLQHRSHEKAIKLFGNQISVYKATNVNGLPPDVSTFTFVSSVTIDPDQPFSYYTDNSGGSSFWYIFTYYNQTNTNETDKSLSEAVRGGGYGHLVSLEDIRHEAGLDDNRRLDNTQVATRRDEAESEINGALAAAGYVLPLQTGTGVLFVPPIVRGIARRLSASFVLSQNHGLTKPGSSKDGKAKADEARQDLAKIQLNDTILIDSNGNMLAKPNLVSGWPDSTTIDTPNSTTAGPTMTINKVF